MKFRVYLNDVEEGEDTPKVWEGNEPHLCCKFLNETGCASRYSVSWDGGGDEKPEHLNGEEFLERFPF